MADHLPANADPRLRQITVRQLLAVTSGLAGDDQLFDRYHWWVTSQYGHPDQERHDGRNLIGEAIIPAIAD